MKIEINRSKNREIYIEGRKDIPKEWVDYVNTLKKKQAEALEILEKIVETQRKLRIEKWDKIEDLKRKKRDINWKDDDLKTNAKLSRFYRNEIARLEKLDISLPSNLDLETQGKLFKFFRDVRDILKQIKIFCHSFSQEVSFRYSFEEAKEITKYFCFTAVDIFNDILEDKEAFSDEANFDSKIEKMFDKQYLDIVIERLKKIIDDILYTVPFIISISKLEQEIFEIPINEYFKIYLSINHFTKIDDDLVHHYIEVIKRSSAIAQKFFIEQLNVDPKYFKGKIGIKVGFPPLERAGVFFMKSKIVEISAWNPMHSAGWKRGLDNKTAMKFEIKNPHLSSITYTLIHELAHRVYYQMGNVLRNKWEQFHNDICVNFTKDQMCYAQNYLSKISDFRTDYSCRNKDADLNLSHQEKLLIKEGIETFEAKDRSTLKLGFGMLFPTRYSLTDASESFAESVANEFTNPSKNASIIRKVIRAIFH